MLRERSWSYIEQINVRLSFTFNSVFLQSQCHLQRNGKENQNTACRIWSYGEVSNPALAWPTKPNMTRTERATRSDHQTTLFLLPFLIRDHTFVTYSALSFVFYGSECTCTTSLFVAGVINALVIVWGFVSACRGMFHTAAEYVACNYLLMCHSIRQSCDPWCSVDSPENGPRRSLTAFRAELSTHISNTKDNGDTHATIRRHTHTRALYSRELISTCIQKL